MLSMLVTAVVGFIGIALGGGVKAWEADRSRKREGIAVLSSLVAEVEAITRLARHRGFLSGLQEMHKHSANMVQEGRGGEPVPFIIISLRHNYFATYEASVGKLGLLDPYMADRITRFYTFAKAALENYHPESPFQKGVTAADALVVSANDLLLLHTVEILGDHIAGFRRAVPPVGIVDPFPQGAPMLPDTVTPALAVTEPAPGTGAAAAHSG